MTSTIICFFTLKFWIGTSRKGDEDRDWKHSTSSCRQKPLSRLIFKRRTDAALIELDVNQRWLTGQGHFRGQSDFNWGRCPSGPTPRSAPVVVVTIRFMILRPLTTRGHPLTTWTLALHSLLHSTSDYNSHHPLHWRHTADCTEHTADYPDTHSWLHWSHSLLKPWTSSLSLPSFVERLASPRC